MPCLNNKFTYIVRYISTLSPYHTPSKTPPTNLQNTISLHCPKKRQNIRSCVSPSRCLTFRKNVTEPVWMLLRDMVPIRHLGNIELETSVASLACQISCPPFCAYCSKVIFVGIIFTLTQRVNVFCTTHCNVIVM
jgi:hypothetical protein